MESMHSTSDDRVERSTNQVDFVDHRVGNFAICRRTDSIFWIDNFETNGPPYHYAPIAGRISHRWFEISRCLHFANNTTLPATGEDGYQRLQKIQLIIIPTERALSSNM